MWYAPTHEQALVRMLPGGRFLAISPGSAAGDRIYEEGRKARLLVNADMGAYAPFMGSAQRLSNGNFHFTASTVRNHASRYARSVETTPDGKIVYMPETRPVYRSTRIADLYTPPR